MREYRPIGVTLIAVFFIIAGVLGTISALGVLFIPLPAPFGNWLIPIGLLGILFGVLHIAVGWGLLEVRDWARIAALLFSALGLVLNLLGGFSLLFGFSLEPFGRLSFPGIGVGCLVVAAICGWIIWYLMKSDVEAIFLKVYPQPLTPPEPTPPPVQLPTARAAPRIEPTRLVEERPPAMAWLVVKSGARVGQQFGLIKGINTIGRDGSRCDIVLEDGAVSAEHARIRFENGQFVIYDLASLNGTFVNNRRVHRQILMDGDVIRLGNTTLVFKKV